MGSRPEVIQRTLLQNPRFQNALPDSVIYNTLELATAWVDGYADLFLFQRVSPSEETCAEMRDNFHLAEPPTGTRNVFAPHFSSSATRRGTHSTGPPGLFGAIGSGPPSPTSSHGASSLSPSYPSSGSINDDGYARQDSLSDSGEEPMEPSIHPSDDESWDYIRGELDRVYQRRYRLNGQSDSDEGTSCGNLERNEADGSGSRFNLHALPWNTLAADPM